jgi:hypothetical protein
VGRTVPVGSRPDTFITTSALHCALSALRGQKRRKSAEDRYRTSQFSINAPAVQIELHRNTDPRLELVHRIAKNSLERRFLLKRLSGVRRTADQDSRSPEHRH